MLPELLNQIPPDEEIGRVTGDGAYDTRKCHNAIAARNAHAVIPPHKNAKLWKPDAPGARARNEAKRSAHQTIWVAHCGGKSLDTTAEAASKQRCIM